MNAPTALALQNITLQSLAERYGFQLAGLAATSGAQPVKFVARIKASREIHSHVLTYVTSSAYAAEFAASEQEYALIPGELFAVLPEAIRTASKSWLICDGAADEAVFMIHCDLAQAGAYPILETDVASSAQIHPSAVLYPGVIVGANTRIDAGAVVYSNSVIGRDVHIKANAVIGGDGFEVRYAGDRRYNVPHTGGVRIGDRSAIGSNTCIDRGIFGTFTEVGEDCHIDNLVHIAHNVQIGRNSCIAACGELSGSMVLGEGVWWSPGACSNHEVPIGDYAYIGTGATVTRAVPAHGLVFGSPAKLAGYMCRCRTKLPVPAGQVPPEALTCGKCGAEFRYENDRLRMIAP